MRRMFRTLTLVTLCAAGAACLDDKPKDPPKPKTPKLEQPAFTATVPARPRSILDTPVTMQPGSTAVGGDASKSGAPSETKPSDAAKLGALLEDKKLEPKDPKETLKELDCEPGTGEPKVDRFVLASGVEEREPVGETDTFFTDTDKIWAFVQFDNELGAPASVRVHWEKVDGPASPYGFVLDVPTAKRYRTWSWTAIKRDPGQYRAVLRTLDGKELGSREFEIKAADSLAQQ
jgi:Protein of unknown function (DUF2914)